jgi:glycosyltransferase involved in cell wall biosynthesis
MRIVFTSYVRTTSFDHPQVWLNRIKGYIGVLEELSKRHQVISIEQINYEGRYAKSGVDYRFIKSENRLFPSTLHNYIRDLNPDIVFVHGMHFPLQVIQLRTKLSKNVKVFLQNHAEKPATGLKKMLQRFADRKIDGYFFTSFEMGEPWLKEKIIRGTEKVHQVMEASSVFGPMNKQEARLKTNVNGHLVYLWVGRLDANKDPLTVIAAFRKFLSHQPNARLYMIYHTEELKEEIVKQIEAFQDNIILVGTIPHADLQPWFSSADFIVSASHYEGSGVAICEGMSCGCIPVLTNIASFRMMTGDGKCGRLYEAGRADQLLSIFIETQTMNIDLERKKVLQQFASVLSFKAIAEKMDQVFTSS